MAVNTINVWEARRREGGLGFFEKPTLPTVTKTSVQTVQLAQVGGLKENIDRLRLLRKDSPGLDEAQKVLITLTDRISSELAKAPQETAAPKTAPSFGA